MNNRAYHLQVEAHQAVGHAIAAGSLTRQPCEVCGKIGQAHHDSYYPEKWLEVRWLCPKHHREWHDENEAEWPTIFEYHPSDSTRFSSKRGRPPTPWFRTFTQSWYTTLDKKKICLGKDRESAFRRFGELMAARFPARYSVENDPKRVVP